MNLLFFDFFSRALNGFLPLGFTIYLAFLPVFFSSFPAFSSILSIFNVSFYFRDYLLAYGGSYFLRNFEVNVDWEACILFYLIIYEPLLDFFFLDFGKACLID